MTKPALINHDEIVDASNTSYIIQPHAHRISFMQTWGDWVYNQSPHDTIYLKESIQTTIMDQTQGMHLHLDPFSLLTTVIGFENDHRGVIDISTRMFDSMAAIAKSLVVIPRYGTELAAEYHGPIVAFFPGDYDVRVGQFHLYRG